VWELAIKTSRKKLVLSDRLEIFVPKWSQAYQLASLPIGERHALTVAKLPDLHGNPFDRILIAQALTEGLRVVGADLRFPGYGVLMVW
jgi:PIN domain nuclease of toxin-antitoxin system